MKCRYCDASYSTSAEVYRHEEMSGCMQRHHERQRALHAVIAAQMSMGIAFQVFSGSEAATVMRERLLTIAFVQPTPEEIVEA